MKAIEAAAPGLRAAGVVSLEISLDRIAVRFASPFGPIDPPRAAAEDEPPVQDPTPEPEPNPLDDPATFGGDVPGYELEDDDA